MDKPKRVVTRPVGYDAGSGPVSFDAAVTKQFLQLVHGSRPAATIIGFTSGVPVPSGGPNRFDAVVERARRERTHLFFHVSNVKAEWGNASTHDKGKVTTASKSKAVNMADGSNSHVEDCPYLWGDCDATKYTGTDAIEAQNHYVSEGIRVSKAIDEGLEKLGIKPFLKWRSGAGWQFLIRLDKPIRPEEAEQLVGRLHIALGFDPVVRNSNRILRVAGSINWKDGKDGRTPAVCTPLHVNADAVCSIEHVRSVLPDLGDAPRGDESRSEKVTVDWGKVNEHAGWLKSVGDLPGDFSLKGKLIIAHEGTLKELGESLVDAGLLQKNYTSWSDVALSLCAIFKGDGRFSLEQIAAALMCDLPCNEHIKKLKGDVAKIERAVERAITRSHAAKVPASSSGLNWPDGTKDSGVPVNGYANTLCAVVKLAECKYDAFRHKEYVHGHDIRELGGELSDAGITMLRHTVRKNYHFYPEKAVTQEAVTVACRNNMFNPVTDYFAGLIWDGIPRIDSLFIDYLGSPDTPLTRAMGRKFCCGLVRRGCKPGCKVDLTPVLDGKQGIGKSMFCRDLAIEDDLYAGSSVFSYSTKELMEVTRGKLVVEISELAGFRETSRERVKSVMTVDADKARMAYDRYAIDQPRSYVFIATKNPGGFLNDPTGERRWIPIAVRRYNREAFLRDRNQIFAEAVAREPAEKLWLDTPELVDEHAALVQRHKAPNELVDVLCDLGGEVFDGDIERVNGDVFITREERISSAAVRAHLGMGDVDVVRLQKVGRQIADAMMHLGWVKAEASFRCIKGGPTTTGYRRPLPSVSAPPEQFELAGTVLNPPGGGHSSPMA